MYFRAGRAQVNIRTKHKDTVRLTGDRYWHIEKGAIPGYKKKHLGNPPLALPDILDLTIEEYQPLVYLVMIGGSRDGTIGELWLERKTAPDATKGATLTKSANIETSGMEMRRGFLKAGLQAGELTVEVLMY